MKTRQLLVHSISTHGWCVRGSDRLEWEEELDEIDGESSTVPGPDHEDLGGKGDEGDEQDGPGNPEWNASVRSRSSKQRRRKVPETVKSPFDHHRSVLRDVRGTSLWCEKRKDERRRCCPSGFTERPNQTPNGFRWYVTVQAHLFNDKQEHKQLDDHEVIKMMYPKYAVNANPLPSFNL